MTNASRKIRLLVIAGLVLAAAPARAQEPAPEPPETTQPATAPENLPEPPSPPIAPAPSPGKEPAPGAPSDPSTNEADKRIGIGADALFLGPVGDFADSTGPIAGPMVHFGYRVLPRLEIALRAGYLFGTKRTQNGVLTKIDILPLWLGARVFVWKPFLGPYLALEGGMNSQLPTLDPPPSTPSGEKATELRRRFGGNAGVGYLVSQDLPIDIRAQVMLLNLIGRDAALKENLNVAVSLSAGYTFQF